MLVDHCQKSNAGLYYADRDEFAEALKLLVRRPPRCAPRWAQTAATTSGTNYRWDVILAKYERMFTKLKGQGRKPPLLAVDGADRVGIVVADVLDVGHVGAGTARRARRACGAGGCRGA